MSESQSQHSSVPPVAIESPECPKCQGQMMSHGRSDHVSGAAFAFRTPLGTVEHPINQVLKFGLSASTLAHEVV